MYDRLTPSGAIFEREGILTLLSMQGAVAMCQPVGIADKDLALANEGYLPALKECVRTSEIVVWDNEIYSAAISGAEAFIGSYVPMSYCEGHNEIWMFALDAKASPQTLKALGLDTDWLIGAMVYMRAKVPKMDPNVLTKPEFALLPHKIQTGILDCLQNQGRYAVDNVLIYTRSNEWTAANIGRAGTEPSVRVMPAGRVYEGDRITQQTACPIAAFHFMNGTVACAREYQANHQTRKQFARAGREIPTVKAVVLRRSEQHRDDSVSMRSDVEWSCQWLVRGHWRKLHEPRKSDGATVTYIQPHTKGPEDKPFRAPRETVYVAKR